MGIDKPASIAADDFKSAKWDEITSGRSFPESAAPTLALLCQWHVVVQRCIDDMAEAYDQVAYQNKIGDIKALPQLSIMKQASAEIRALNKQLGINDEPEKKSVEVKVTTFDSIKERRRNRAARAKNTG